MNRYSLRRIRRWLFISPHRTFPGKGSLTLYPRSAVPMILRFGEVLRKTRNGDQSVWTTWLEGFPVEIGKWADVRLARFEELLRKVASVDEKMDASIDAISRTMPTRTSARSSISNRFRFREEFYSSDGPPPSRQARRRPKSVRPSLTPVRRPETGGRPERKLGAARSRTARRELRPTADARRIARGDPGRWNKRDATAK